MNPDLKKDTLKRISIGFLFFFLCDLFSLQNTNCRLVCHKNYEVCSWNCEKQRRI